MSPEHALAAKTSFNPEKKFYACIKMFELKNMRKIFSQSTYQGADIPSILY